MIQHASTGVRRWHREKAHGATAKYANESCASGRDRLADRRGAVERREVGDQVGGGETAVPSLNRGALTKTDAALATRLTSVIRGRRSAADALGAARKPPGKRAGAQGPW